MLLPALVIALIACPTPPKVVSREESARHYFLGMAAVAKGNHLRAAWEFTRAVHFDPTNARAWSARGSLFLANEQSQLAVADLTRALELDPADTPARLRRGCGYGQLGQLRDATADLDLVLETSPDEPAALRLRALAFAGTHLYELAAEDYSALIRLNPNDGTAIHGRGDMFAHLGRHAEARTDFGRYVELNRDHPHGYLRRGQVAAELGDRAAAARDFTRVIGFAPDAAPVYRLRAAVLSADGKHAAALADLERVASLEPTADAIKDLARFRLDCPDAKLKDVSRGLDLARKASEWAWVAATRDGRPFDPTYDQLRASAEAAAGDHERAITILDRLAANPLSDDDRRRVNEQSELFRRIAALREKRAEKPAVVVRAQAELPPLLLPPLPPLAEVGKVPPGELPPIIIPVIEKK